MADMQLNMRVSEEVADRFRAFCKDQGISQPQGMDSLLSMMELVQAKEAMPNRQTEIEGFEMHIKAVMDAFVNSLAVNADAEERVKQQFISSLESKDKTIMNLQDQVEAYKTMLVDAQSAQQQSEDRTAAAEAATAAAEKAKAAAEQATEAARQTAEDKAAIADMLTAKLQEAETKLAGYDDLSAAVQDGKAKVAELQGQMKEAEYAHKTAAMEAEIKVAKEKAAVQEQAAKDREQQERTHAAEIKALYEKMSAYQDEITSLSKSLIERQDEIAALNKGLSEKQDEIAALSKALTEKQEQEQPEAKS